MDSVRVRRRRKGASLLDAVLGLVILVLSVSAVSRTFVTALMAEKKAANGQAAAAAVHQRIEEMRQTGASALATYAGDKVLWRKTTYDEVSGQVLYVSYEFLPEGTSPSQGANERIERIGSLSVTISDFSAKVKSARLESRVGSTKGAQSRVVAQALFGEE